MSAPLDRQLTAEEEERVTQMVQQYARLSDELDTLLVRSRVLQEELQRVSDKIRMKEVLDRLVHFES